MKEIKFFGKVNNTTLRICDTFIKYQLPECGAFPESQIKKIISDKVPFHIFL